MAVAAHSFDFEAFCQFAMEHHGPWFFNSTTVLCTQGRDPASTDTRSPHELLEDAKRLIDEFLFIGFTETFNQSVARLQRRVGWLPETIAHANAAPPSQLSTDRKFHSWLADATAVDDQLYEYALKKSHEHNFSADP
jgi:hypothetical protein